MKFNTALLHNNSKEKNPSGATLMPIYQVSAFSHESAEQLEKVFNKKGEDTGIRLVKSKKELEAAVDKRYGKPIYRRQLDDGTKINYRVDSKTGGETIDINNKNPKVNIKIHIDKKI